MQHLETVKNHFSDLSIHNVHSVIHNPDYTTLFTDETERLMQTLAKTPIDV